MFISYISKLLGRQSRKSQTMEEFKKTLFDTSTDHNERPREETVASKCVCVLTPMGQNEINDLSLSDEVSRSFKKSKRLPWTTFNLVSITPVVLMTCRMDDLAESLFFELLTSAIRLRARMVCAAGETIVTKAGVCGVLTQAGSFGPPISAAIVGSIVLPRDSHWVDENIANLLKLRTEHSMSIGERQFVPIDPSWVPR